MKKNTYEVIENVVKSAANKIMTDEKLEALIKERYEICKKVVQALTGVDISNIPLICESDLGKDGNHEQIAVYTCTVSQSYFAFSQTYKGNDRIRVSLKTMKEYYGYCLLNTRILRMFIDSALTHELFHAVDAHTGSTVFTENSMFEFGLSEKELYTDWRAYKALTSTIYKGVKSADRILRKQTRLYVEDFDKFEEGIPQDRTYTAALETVKNSVTSHFIF